MIGVAVRYFLFFGIMFWYSNGMWNLINDYFQQRFKAYLAEEMKVSNRKLSADSAETSSSHSSTVVREHVVEPGSIMLAQENPFRVDGEKSERVSIKIINEVSPILSNDDNEKTGENIKGRNFQPSISESSLTCNNDDNRGNTCDMSLGNWWAYH
ncbi:uncharacterized protein LOC129799588 [Phlebotomus papatasi]|uniref:uncharacterized protein LOC129799588 n=1 Tax=Phlebotomus papatasi TaxID=29031 RepID=UPI002483DEF1|nr:uncharacterized protein LOC129799588 [Phlebotomus papatasi]